MYLVELGGARRLTVAAAVFIVGGALVEFWWFGVALAVAAHAYLRSPSSAKLSLVVAAATTLAMINTNFWALGGLVIEVGGLVLRLEVPRLRWFFYVYYPAHLGVLWLAQRAFV